MINKKLLCTTGAAFLSAGFFSSAVTAANFASSNANATVLTPLSIAQTGAIEMDFGDVAGDSIASTHVVLATDGTTSSPDGASVSGSPAAGSFDVSGASDALYNIILPSSILIDDGGVNTMTVDTFTTSAGAGTLNATGNQTFTVGARLTISNTQVLGGYSGPYNVTVNYQ